MSWLGFWNTLFFCIVPSFFTFTALAAPPQSLNKTVTVRYGHFTPATCSNGRPNRFTRAVTQQVYISTQGRLFARTSAAAGSASRQKDLEPSSSGQYRFSGDKIVSTRAAASGAIQETITFDSSYQNCSAEVVTGLEAGKPYVWISLFGHRCTATGRSVVSNVSCSVSQGNTFAD